MARFRRGCGEPDKKGKPSHPVISRAIRRIGMLFLKVLTDGRWGLNAAVKRRLNARLVILGRCTREGGMGGQRDLRLCLSGLVTFLKIVYSLGDIFQRNILLSILLGVV